MDVNSLPEYVFANGIEELLNTLEKIDTKFTLREVSRLVGVNYTRLSRASTGSQDKCKVEKFNKMSRVELLKKIIEVSGLPIKWLYSEEQNKILINDSEVDLSISNEEVYNHIYKSYYWRSGQVKVGVGLMLITVLPSGRPKITLLIDNYYPQHEIEHEPYVMVSTRVEEYGGNTYVDFKDTKFADFRQVVIFHTPTAALASRKIVEGVFNTLTRNPRKPIAGAILIESLSDQATAFFNNASINVIKDPQAALNHVDNIHNVPELFYNFLYRRRLETSGTDFLTRKSLTNYHSWTELRKFSGVYEGHYIRTSENILEIFLLQFNEDGSALIHFPLGGGVRRNPEGHFKWVNKPENLLTGSFGYDPNQDHWRFRFLLDGEMKDGSFLYGTFAGTEPDSKSPVSGRVRLRMINEAEYNLNKQGNKNNTVDEDGSDTDKSQDKLHKYKEILKKIQLYSKEYWDLLTRDKDLKEFLSGKYKPAYTDYVFTNENMYNETIGKSTGENIVTGKSFLEPINIPFYSGEYEIYSLYRRKVGDDYKYFILKQPIRINDDGTVEIKIRKQEVKRGIAMHSGSVLKINFDKDVTAYTHILLTINQLHYDMIDHAYGVLTGINIQNNRSEATIAVLIGPNSMEAKGKRKLDFDINPFEEYEVGEEKTFQLDKLDPAKLATFVSGHFNRFISPPAEPNLVMRSRLSKYRLPYFKAACYAGMNLGRNLGRLENTTAKQAYTDDLFKQCLISLEEAFQHGFCDPLPLAIKSDQVDPKEDLDMLVDEILPGGSMESLVDEVLNLCDKWNRQHVRKTFDERRLY